MYTSGANIGILLSDKAALTTFISLAISRYVSAYIVFEALKHKNNFRGIILFV